MNFHRNTYPLLLADALSSVHPKKSRGEDVYLLLKYPGPAEILTRPFLLAYTQQESAYGMSSTKHGSIPSIPL